MYEPKIISTQVVVKSVHTYRTLKQTETADVAEKFPFSLRDANKKLAENKNSPEHKVLRSNSEIKKSEVDKHQFILKKQERQNDVAEIKEMLKQINGFNEKLEGEQKFEEIKITNEVNTVPGEKEVNSIEHEIIQKDTDQPKENVPVIPISERSKTDINLVIPKFSIVKKNVSTPKRRSQTARSKSSINLTVDDSPSKRSPKRKAYNPEEARKFMEEQKKKRKMLEKSVKAEKVASKIDRDEIKKRLENLRKSTLNILDKNVKKAKNIQTGHQKPPPVTPIERIKKPIKETAKEQKVSANNVESANKVLKPSNSKESVRLHQPPSSTNKKIGLLRKLDTENVSLSPMKELNMGKENIISDIASKLPDKALNVEIKESDTKDSAEKDDIEILNANTLKLAESELKMQTKKNSDNQGIVNELKLCTGSKIRYKNIC